MIHHEDQVEMHFRLKPPQQSALRKLGITTIHDLLYHFPARYEKVGVVKTAATAKQGEFVTLYGTLQATATTKTFRGKMPVAKATLHDGTKTVELTWFNQPYIAKMFPVGTLVRVTGKIGARAKLSIANPTIERIHDIPQETAGPLFFSQNDGDTDHNVALPVYPESRGVTSRWIYYAIQKSLAHGALDSLDDPIPQHILKKYNLPTLATALIWIHAGKNPRHVAAARKRFSFEEIFLIQLGKQQERHLIEQEHACLIPCDTKRMRKFIERFPFSPTSAQEKAIEVIAQDMSREKPMSRLLEGDVGSGKTFVAAVTAHAVTAARDHTETREPLQTAYMVPTEILAKQQFESFVSFFRHLPVSIGLLTSAACKKFPSKVDPAAATDISKRQLLRWVANGEIPILIGTHALIQKSVAFRNLACVIIDEQHRFGTAQRAALAQKNERMPHLLSMTATPIPRTLALTLYGDLDLTLLDEMPRGRKPIITEIVSPDRRAHAYEMMRHELVSGRQAYVICPRIDEPDPQKELALIAKSVMEETARLTRDVFPQYSIGMLHGNMKPKEREETMRDFLEHRIHILVATSVIEVGVNVPNATVILIEGADRFGLAQLHQLRGRVIRSEHQPYCFVLSESKSATVRARLKALKTAKNGFELAEHDLRIRGAGELYGKKQWGITDVGMDALKNIKMVEAARAEAQALALDLNTLVNHPSLSDMAQKKVGSLHFE